MTLIDNMEDFALFKDLVAELRDLYWKSCIERPLNHLFSKLIIN